MAVEPTSETTFAVLTTFTVLAAVIHALVKALTHALAALPAPKVNNQTTSSTKETTPTDHLMTLSVVERFQASPSHVIEVVIS